MRYREVCCYTKNALRGHYAKALTAALLYPAGKLLMGLCPCFLAAVLIAKGRMTPKGLLMGEEPLWILLFFLWDILCFLLLLPAFCGMYSWFSRLMGLEGRGTPRIFFADAKGFCKAAWYFGTAAVLRFLSFLPLAAALKGFGMALRYSMGTSDSGMGLFAAVQCLFGALWGLGFVLWVSLGLAAMPCLYLDDPDLPPLRGALQSMRIMAGSRRFLLGLYLGWIPAVLMPLLLPGVLGRSTLFLQLRIRECKQAWERELPEQTMLPE